MADGIADLEAERVLRRAKRAEELLKDEVLAAALNEQKEELLQCIATSEPEQKDYREQCYREIYALGAVEKALERFVNEAVWLKRKEAPRG